MGALLLDGMDELDFKEVYATAGLEESADELARFLIQTFLAEKPADFAFRSSFWSTNIGEFSAQITFDRPTNCWGVKVSIPPQAEPPFRGFGTEIDHSGTLAGLVLMDSVIRVFDVVLAERTRRAEITRLYGVLEDALENEDFRFHWQNCLPTSVHSSVYQHMTRAAVDYWFEFLKQHGYEHAGL